MSRRRSQLSKILRSADRMERKQVARERAGKIEGETEEQELARKVRDLEGYLQMKSELELERAVKQAAAEADTESSDVELDNNEQKEA